MIWTVIKLPSLPTDDISRLRINAGRGLKLVHNRAQCELLFTKLFHNLLIMATNSEKSNPAQKNRAYLGNTQQNNPLSNPCIKEQKLSLDCIERNIGNKDACEAYFLNYKVCRAFWNQVIYDRRQAGIKPYLPLPEDRPEILAKQRSSRR